ncbi:MAG: WG repeat-containing protein, partial [Oscillospiraceae bacterium]|nr:WG repeat-containing protein [Oscillospiraceae bacterium]
IRVGNNGKFGLFGITKIEYDRLDFENGYALVKKGNYYGIIDAAGNIIVPFEYRDNRLTRFNRHGLATAAKSVEDSVFVKWGCFDTNGDVAIPFIYDRLLIIFNNNEGLIDRGWGEYDDSYISAKKDGKWGVLDKYDKIIIPFEYDDIVCFQTNGLAWANKDGKIGAINIANETVIPFEFDGLPGYYNFRFDPIRVMKDGKWRYIDLTGKTVIPFEFEYAGGEFYNEYAIIGENGKYGMMDKTGKIIIPIEYEWVVYDSESKYFSTQKNGKYGFIDIDGNMILPFEYNDPIIFRDGIAQVWKDGGKRMFIDIYGKVILTTESYTLGFIYGIILMENGGKYAFYDTAGNVVPPNLDEYDMVFRSEYDGIYYVSINDKRGLINRTGKIILPLEYEVVYFYGDYIAVQKDGRWGVLTFK